MAATSNLVPRPRVVIDRPEQQCLLGLLLGQMFGDLVRHDAPWRRAQKIRGDLEIQLGTMTATVRFGGGGGSLLVLHGSSPAPRARLRGDMTSFVTLARGGPAEMIATLLRGRVRVWGHPLFLLQLLPLVRQPQGSTNAPTQRTGS